MKSKKFGIRTIGAIIIVTVVIIGFHTYNDLKIQTSTFDEKWGRGVEIGESGLNRSPLISNIENNILVLTFTRSGNINYYLIDEKGSILKNDSMKLENFNANKSYDIYLEGNNLFYLKDNKVYISKFDEISGFNESKEILTGASGLRVDEVLGELLIQTYGNDDNKITISSFKDNKIAGEFSYKVNNEITDAFVRQINDQKYLFFSIMPDVNRKELHIGKIINDKLEDIHMVENRPVSSYMDFKDINAVTIDEKIYLGYTTTQNVKGITNKFKRFKIIDGNTLEVLNSNYISEIKLQGILGDEFQFVKFDDKVNIFGSSINNKSNYSEMRDIFRVEINNKGELSEPYYISNTEKISKKPKFLKSSNGSYLCWLDNGTTNDRLMINSTNKNFIKESRDFTKHDFFNSTTKSLIVPFYAIAYIFFRGINIIFAVAIAYLILGFTIRKLKVDNDKIKFICFAALYVILNFIMFKNDFYRSGFITYMPRALSFDFARYIMPLLINLVSFIIMSLYYTKDRRVNYLAYIVMFIGIDIFLNYLIYVPFIVRAQKGFII